MQSDYSIGNILYDIAVYIFIALFVGISQAAGIGGGPIISVSLILGLGYETKAGMAITYIFLIGGSVASIYSNYGRRTSDGKRNLIDARIVMITLPLTVSGSIFGSIFNHFINEFIITVSFTVLLSFIAWSSYQKYKALSQQKPKQPLLQKQSIQLKDLKNQETNLQLQAILKQELVPFSKRQISIFLQIIIFTLILLLCKGSQQFPSLLGLEPCGFGTWFCVFLHLGFSIYYARSIAQQISTSDSKKQSLGHVFSSQQDRMSQNFMKQAMILGFSAGFIGGSLGIGGAIILVPAWLEMGIDKNIASSTSPPLIFSSAFIAMTIAFLSDFYHSFSSVLFYFVFSFVASYYVKQAITWIKTTYKMQGILFILLIILMIMSLVFLLPYEINMMIETPQKFFQFGALC